MSTNGSRHVSQPRPEYVPSYHYPPGADIPFEHAVLCEQCYVNLKRDDVCPRCNSNRTNMLAAGGPVRTHPNLLKVRARAYKCEDCLYGYVTAETTD